MLPMYIQKIESTYESFLYYIPYAVLGHDLSVYFHHSSVYSAIAGQLAIILALRASLMCGLSPLLPSIL